MRVMAPSTTVISSGQREPQLTLQEFHTTFSPASSPVLGSAEAVGRGIRP